MSVKIIYEDDIQSIELPKWPAIVVTGKKLNLEDTTEIMFRTSSFHLSSNDSSFERKFYDLFGIKYSDEGGNYIKLDYDSIESVSKFYQLLNLQYLQNNRISSCWVGGPHGWLNWNGDIFCNNFNIGKWPSVEDVAKDWFAILESFPYLIIKCQLFNGESDEPYANDRDKFPLVEYIIGNDIITVRKPKLELVVPIGLDSKDIYSMLTPGHEQGITIEELCDRKLILDNRMKSLKRIIDRI